MRIFFFCTLIFVGLAAVGCSRNASAASSSTTQTTQAATPTISTKAALNGAIIVSLSSATSNAQIYYTIDGTTPSSSSQLYRVPFLVASDITIEAVAIASGETQSAVASKTFTLGIGSGTLVWSDEFANTTGANMAPDADVWSYDTGNGSSGW